MKLINAILGRKRQRCEGHKVGISTDFLFSKKKRYAFLHLLSVIIIKTRFVVLSYKHTHDRDDNTEHHALLYRRDIFLITKIHAELKRNLVIKFPCYKSRCFKVLSLFPAPAPP